MLISTTQPVTVDTVPPSPSRPTLPAGTDLQVIRKLPAGNSLFPHPAFEVEAGGVRFYVAQSALEEATHEDHHLTLDSFAAGIFT